MDVIQLNKDLQQEGQMLLDSTGLIQKLNQFGTIEIGGSFIYGTMVDRDIDIAVIVNKADLNRELRKNIINILLDMTELEGLELTDRVQFPKNSSPYGIWFGPKIRYKGSKWNIDIWFVTQDEPNSHHNLRLHKRMLQITKVQRKTILEIKYTALIKGTKDKGITSSIIYEAVLDQNISSYQEFIDLVN